MNTQNYTQKTVEAIQNAQNIARENDNQSLVPEHLLYSLLDQDGGLIPSLFGKMGVDCNTVLGELDSYIATLPKVSGGEMYLSSETDRVIRAAEKTAKSMNDEYVSVEHLMLGIFTNMTPEIRKIFNTHGITKNAFVDELSKVKGQISTITDRIRTLRKEVTLCDGRKTEYTARIERMEKECITLQILASASSVTEPRCSVTLYQGLPKTGKLETIVQKCVELGVSRIIPFQAARSVV